MRYLRTVSTHRLLAMLTGLVIAIAGGTAIAVAASGSGPVPAQKPLPNAIHQALTAPTVSGITARITFTNHLIDASALQGSDPILGGASGRLWLSPGTHQLRLELQGNNGDAQIVVNGRSVWAYDPSTKTAYKGTLPADRPGAAAKARANDGGPPSIAQIQNQLTKLAEHLNISGAQPSDVAGQPTYTVTVSPRHDGGLLGSAELAWDAVRGIPLRFAVYAQGNSQPVLELKASDISYGAVDKSVFGIAPPRDAKVVKVAAPAAGTEARPARAGHGLRAHRHPEVSGVAAVASHLPFTLVAPDSLVGLPRHSVTRLDWAGHPAALVTYGQNLGGLAVIEQQAKPGSAPQPPSGSGRGDRRGLNLPTVSINGTTAQELDTALGTVVRFTRGGVSYTVLGSIPAAAADAAARAL